LPRLRKWDIKNKDTIQRRRRRRHGQKAAGDSIFDLAESTRLRGTFFREK
jgi:hypothetical protein